MKGEVVGIHTMKGGVVGERELRSRLATEGGLTVGSLQTWVPP
jgi:hypothetical protein